MDPVTTAILAALGAGLVSGAAKVGENLVSDAYQSLKSLIQRKFGPESKVANAVSDVEANPTSEGRKLTLAEEITTAKADQDAEVLQAAKDLLAKIEAQPGGKQVIVTVSGSRAVGAGGNISGSTIVTGNQNKTGGQ